MSPQVWPAGSSSALFFCHITDSSFWKNKCNVNVNLNKMEFLSCQSSAQGGTTLTKDAVTCPLLLNSYLLNLRNLLENNPY